MASGGAALIGHCFPFYLKLKGGKGLACFGGIVLAYDPLLFLFLLIVGVVWMILVNHSVALPLLGAVLFAGFVALFERDVPTLILALVICTVIVITHFGNLRCAMRGEDILIRDYIKTKLFHKNNAD